MSIANSTTEAKALLRIANYIRNQYRRKNIQSPVPIKSFHLSKETINLYKKSHKGMHVDHIVPGSWFDLRNESEISACFHFANLRLISACENLSRKDRLTSKEISEFDKIQRKILLTASQRPMHLLNLLPNNEQTED
ncbi:MAG: hypothetical protein V7L23_29775 [Nostoc sp.]|uniref:hypothetical protein n=1 Tax=Nostoc sp. TaxID=1180 RepID=UPI002FF2EAA9